MIIKVNEDTGDWTVDPFFNYAMLSSVDALAASIARKDIGENIGDMKFRILDKKLYCQLEAGDFLWFSYSVFTRRWEVCTNPLRDVGK